jgi:biotin transport system substrate-specific component
MKLRNMIFSALFAAVLCAVAPFSIPIGPIPLSLATFVIYIAAATINWKYGTLAVVLYVLMGLIGLPVFAGPSGGIQKLVGPTGGFIIGYILCALVIGLIVDRFETKRWAYPVAMLLGTVVLYALGTTWFIVLMKVTLAKALMSCVVFFLPGDAAKIILASVIAPILRKALKRQRG